jgi:hypothetical protein
VSAFASLAILHFHLQPGGVTQVVRNHLFAWNAAWKGADPLPVAVLHGGRASGWDRDLMESLPRLDLRLIGVPELEYDDLRETIAGDGDRLARAIGQALEGVGFARDRTLLHWHNHSVGKNAAAPIAIARLAEQGFRQLLQIHDFAEDARPANYAHLRAALGNAGSDPLPLYPLAKSIRYATLTGRDRGFLIEAGMPAEAVSVLPNPVHAGSAAPDGADARAKVLSAIGRPDVGRWGLYPVRGIRRKNVGELLLWAAFAPVDVAYGITLRPETPAEARSYDAWKRIAEELRLNVAFDVGTLPGIDFATNVAAADALFTTSVAEGFGMAFLETTLAQKPLLGRDLPDITADFREEGIAFPGLVDAIDVPLGWIGEAGLEELRAAYLDQCATYALDEDFGEGWSRHESELRHRAAIDFGALLPCQQRRIVAKLARDPAAREELDELNPAWAALREAWHTGEGDAVETPSADRVAGLACYSIERLGESLLETARSIFASAPFDGFASSADSRKLARTFLAPERFRPVRYVDFDGS